MRQGTHHVAKKFTSTHRPRYVANRAVVPSIVAAVTSGAGCPNNGEVAATD